MDKKTLLLKTLMAAFIVPILSQPLYADSQKKHSSRPSKQKKEVICDETSSTKVRHHHRRPEIKKPLPFILTESSEVDVYSEPEPTTTKCPIMVQLLDMYAPAPINSDGAALFNYINTSNQLDQNIFIQVIGINPQTQSYCFISYTEDGTPTYVNITGQIDSKNYSYPLSFFNSSQTGQGRSLYLPKLGEGTLYTSINSPLSFPVTETPQGLWTLQTPKSTDPNDPNSGIIWDQTGYIISQNIISVNAISNSGFSLPLFVEEDASSGASESSGIKTNRSAVFDAMQQACQEAGAPWTNLVLNKPSFILSPLSAAQAGLFPQNYLSETGWMNAFITTFSENDLSFDLSLCLPINFGGGVWQGRIDPTSLVFTFNRVVDDTHPQTDPVTLSIPSDLSELLSGSGPSWNFENQIQVFMGVFLSFAIKTNTLSTKEALCSSYFQSQNENFFNFNENLSSELQYIDLYGKSLKQFMSQGIYNLHQVFQTPTITPSNFAGGNITLNLID